MARRGGKCTGVFCRASPRWFRSAQTVAVRKLGRILVQSGVRRADIFTRFGFHVVRRRSNSKLTSSTIKMTCKQKNTSSFQQIRLCGTRGVIFLPVLDVEVPPGGRFKPGRSFKMPSLKSCINIETGCILNGVHSCTSAGCAAVCDHCNSRGAGGLRSIVCCHEA